MSRSRIWPCPIDLLFVLIVLATFASCGKDQRIRVSRSNLAVTKLVVASRKYSQYFVQAILSIKITAKPNDIDDT